MLLRYILFFFFCKRNLYTFFVLYYILSLKYQRFEILRIEIGRKKNLTKPFDVGHFYVDISGPSEVQIIVSATVMGLRVIEFKVQPSALYIRS